MQPLARRQAILCLVVGEPQGAPCHTFTVFVAYWLVAEPRIGLLM